jgi:hypothetical protein
MAELWKALESQNHGFPQLLGNLPKTGDSHILTAPAAVVFTGMIEGLRQSKPKPFTQKSLHSPKIY